jgi:hypothetical protein
MAASIRIWEKKQLRLDKLTFKQREMVDIGSAGLLSVFQRLSKALGPKDSPAKPLGKGYAIFKTRKGKGNRRDLKLTGDMLRNLSLRTVSETSAKAALTSRKQKVKGWANTKREPWLLFSPANRKAVMGRAQRIVQDRLKRLAVSRRTGIDIG